MLSHSNMASNEMAENPVKGVRVEKREGNEESTNKKVSTFDEFEEESHQPAIQNVRDTIIGQPESGSLTLDANTHRKRKIPAEFKVRRNPNTLLHGLGVQPTIEDQPKVNTAPTEAEMASISDEISGLTKQIISGSDNLSKVSAL